VARGCQGEALGLRLPTVAALPDLGEHILHGPHLGFGEGETGLKLWVSGSSAVHRVTSRRLRCVTHALGLVPSFRIHALASPMGNQPFVLNPPGSAQADPFWVVGAPRRK
jgi:hypothetical protein